MDQQITICGNLTREPELRFTTGGKGVCGFALAVNRRYQQNGEWKDAPPWFINVDAWDTLGENAAASLKKGDRVVVTGRLETQSWEKDGVEQRREHLIVDEIAASLKWATVEITRIHSGGGGGRQADAAPQQTATRSPGRPANPIYGDEEPF